MTRITDLSPFLTHYHFLLSPFLTISSQKAFVTFLITLIAFPASLFAQTEATTTVATTTQEAPSSTDLIPFLFFLTTATDTTPFLIGIAPYDGQSFFWMARTVSQDDVVSFRDDVTIPISHDFNERERAAVDNRNRE